ncbi:MAG: glycosyltransferase family 39 protein [Candidatus Acidiferrales bacterium]
MTQSVEVDAKMAESDASAWLSDRAAVRWLAVLVAYAAVRSVVAAASKPFWYDEMCTWILTQQASVRAIWSALERAADSQGLAFYVIERTMGAMIPNQEIALRLPSILGFCCLTICIFVFVRRRVGSTIALICSLVPFTTVLFHVYAIEARAYSLVVACVAVALVCYQRASSWRWLGLMAFCLALADSLHYYAVFALIPFGLAEAARFLRTKEFRVGVWLALLCGVVPLVIFWPLLSRFRVYYGAHYYARPSLFGIAAMYGAFFEAAAQWGVAVAGALALGVLGAALSGVMGKSNATVRSESTFDEQVLILALLGLPFAGYVVTKVAHGGLTERYMLPAVLGVSLALGYISPRLGRTSVTLLAAFLLFGVGAQEAGFWLSHRGPVTDSKWSANSIERLVKAAGHEDLPVVVSDGLEFLPLVHYGGPYWQSRLVCLVDPGQSLVFAGADGVDKQLLVLLTLAPIHVDELGGFAAQHPAFLVYSTGNGDPYDWWPARLLRDGYSLDVVGTDGSRKIYLVNAGKISH